MQQADRDWLTSRNLDPLFWIPERLGQPSAWWGHVPFAFWLIAKCRPRLLVELGTHYGVSYAAFCEPVLRLGTRDALLRGRHVAGRPAGGPLRRGGLPASSQSSTTDATAHFRSSCARLSTRRTATSPTRRSTSCTSTATTPTRRRVTTSTRGGRNCRNAPSCCSTTPTSVTAISACGVFSTN